MTFGQIKVYAHRLVNGEAIPVFTEQQDQPRYQRARQTHSTRADRAVCVGGSNSFDAILYQNYSDALLLAIRKLK